MKLYAIVGIASLLIATSGLAADTAEAAQSVVRVDPCIGDIICAPCLFPLPLTIVGYSHPLFEPISGFVLDTGYKAAGTFNKVADELDGAGNVVYYKYQIQAGFSQFADKCY